MAQRAPFFDIAAYPVMRVGAVGENSAVGSSSTHLRRSESAFSASGSASNQRPASSPTSSSAAQNRYRPSSSSSGMPTDHQAVTASSGRVRCSSEMSADETYSPVDPAFLVACREGDDNRIRQLMTSRALTTDMVNFRDRTGKTGVSYICANGNISLLELISPIPSLDVNVPDNEGNAPLHFATQAGHIDVVHHLLNLFNQIQLDQRNNLGFTPLMKAAIQGRAKCAKLLLAAGASPVLRDYGRGLCSSEWARFCGRQPCAEVLDKFMKNANYSPAALHRQLRDLEKCASEPNLQFFLCAENKESWLRQKLKRAFNNKPHDNQQNGARAKPDYSLAGNLTNVALCASSPVVPTARVKNQPSDPAFNQQQSSSSNNNHVTSSSSHSTKGSNNANQTENKQLTLPKVEVTEANLGLDNGGNSGGNTTGSVASHRRDKSNGVAVGASHNQRCKSAK